MGLLCRPIVLFLAALALSARADIPWPDVEKRLADENARLAKRPGGHNGVYFVVCTLYYTPLESGFTAARGFDGTSETRKGLGGHKYAKAFLDAVRKEGYGCITTPVRELRFVRYEGNGRYGFSNGPKGLRGVVPIIDRKSGAVKLNQLSLYRGKQVKIIDPTITTIFGNDTWTISDTGGGVRKWQIDLYWGEDEPRGPQQTARPRGTNFEYGLTYIRLEPSR